MHRIRKLTGEHWIGAVKMKASKGRIRSVAKILADKVNAGDPDTTTRELRARLDAEVQRKIANGQLTKAPKKTTIVAVQDDLIAEIREAGFITQKPTRKCEEFAITDVDLRTYPYLIPPEHGSKVVDRLAEDDEDDDTTNDDEE